MSNEKNLATIPYFAHEGDMDRLERINKRSLIVIILLIITLVATNLGWLFYESQFISEETEVSQEVNNSNGDATVTAIGNITYGENQTNS